MEVMTESDVLDKIDEQAIEDGMYTEKGVYAEDLSGIGSVAQEELLVDEGADYKRIEIRQANFLSLGIFYPDWLLETLEGVAPAYSDELEGPPKVIDSPSSDVQALARGANQARAKGFVKWLAVIAQDLGSHDRDATRYEYSLYRNLVEANANRLNIDTNPWETKAFLCRQVPKRIHTDDPDKGEEKDHEVNSAADW